MKYLIIFQYHLRDMDETLQDNDEPLETLLEFTGLLPVQNTPMFCLVHCSVISKKNTRLFHNRLFHNFHFIKQYKWKNSQDQFSLDLHLSPGNAASGKGNSIFQRQLEETGLI